MSKLQRLVGGSNSSGHYFARAGPVRSNGHAFRDRVERLRPGYKASHQSHARRQIDFPGIPMLSMPVDKTVAKFTYMDRIGISDHVI